MVRILQLVWRVSSPVMLRTVERQFCFHGDAPGVVVAYALCMGIKRRPVGSHGTPVAMAT